MIVIAWVSAKTIVLCSVKIFKNTGIHNYEDFSDDKMG